MHRVSMAMTFASAEEWHRVRRLVTTGNEQNRDRLAAYLATAAAG